MTGADNAGGTTKPHFKVVYAFAADRPNRFDGWKDALQANVAIVQRFLSAQDGGTKALRIDMGTRCGPQYVDIQVVQLPGTRASYADNFGAISSAVRGALGNAAGPRNAIILADGLAGGAQEYGLGETIMGTSGERPGAQNVHNRGGLTSILFSRDGGAAPGAAAGAGGRRASCTRPRTTSAPSSGARRTRRSRAASRCPSTAIAGRARTSCATPRTAAPRTRCRPTARACPARSRRTTTAAATTTSTLRPRPTPTSRRTGTRMTRRSSRRAARSPRPAAAARCGSRSRRRPRRARGSPARRAAAPR